MVGSLLGCSSLQVKSRRELEAEILVLRYQVNMLRRRARRCGRPSNVDRLMFVWLLRELRTQMVEMLRNCARQRSVIPRPGGLAFNGSAWQRSQCSSRVGQFLHGAAPPARASIIANAIV